MPHMKKNTLIYRQGDVLIERIESIPNDAIRQKPSKHIILAHGEATGHHHSILGRDADWWKDGNKPTEDGTVADQFVTVKCATALEHQEHAPVTLEPGHYRVRRQREYSPEAIRNVRD